MPFEAIPEVLWGPILAAAGGDDAARPLLLGLGSSSRRYRGLVRRLLPFSWAASAETWFGPTLPSKRWEYASMRQNSGRAHLERSWVLVRADLTEPEVSESLLSEDDRN